MPIEGVNTAMTPLQFSRARSLSRSVETSSGATSGAKGSQGGGWGARARSVAILSDAPHRLLPPATFHWSYRRAMVNGKPAAKRTPQLADTSYWSFAVNRLG